ncbi:MAG TPA: hypothetical protein VNA23_02335 [Anaerolineales bacterium]|nr:hypothetical protein [Anaerolineales bacterium]
MRRDNIFWGGALILLGVLLFLQARGIISNIFTFFWPIALILAGGWMIMSVYWRSDESLEDTFSVPLGAAKSIKYSFAHGAAQIEINGNAPMGQALVGTSAVGMNQRSQLNGDMIDVQVEAGPSFVPFIGPSQGVWRYQLTREVPVTLSIGAGESSLDINLQDVLATHIELETGASSASMTLPARGVSVLNVEAGAASVSIRVPESTAARIRVEEGVTAVSVDTNRFAKLDSYMYQSPNFDSARDRAEINIEAGLGTVSVK